MALAMVKRVRKKTISTAQAPDLVRALLDWYATHARIMPWRVPPNATVTGRPDPYPIWLSEVMLQQTTVRAVMPYYAAFVAKWPDVGALAAAELDAVLTQWAGLGYYARARNLHKCAGVLVADHGGFFPDNETALAALPGIGPYTAAAIAAIAFDARATPVDGNVERVMARLHDVDEPLPRAKPTLKRHAQELTAALLPVASAGDYAQAVMELGATVCLPRRPRCAMCPWAAHCRARASGRAEALPKRAAKKVKPLRRGTVYWTQRRDGAVLLRRRPETGLLGGMMEIPTGEWREGRRIGGDDAAPFAADWRRLPGVVNHSFTHFDLELWVMAGATPAGRGTKTAPGWVWVQPDELGAYALPSVMQKVVRHALGKI